MSTGRHNWARNYAFRAARWHEPETLEQVREIVAKADKVRAIGARHSFNGIADCADDMICMSRLDRIVALDRARQTVTVEAGIRYGALGAFLHRNGFALHNLASLPHISVAGAVATATHGSGDRNGNLATAVCGLELVTATGETVRLTRADADFAGAVVGLGALAVVTKVTLDVRPSFPVRQRVYEGLPLATLLERFDEVMGSAYSVSLFTHWREGVIEQVWLKSLGDGEEPAAAPVFAQARMAGEDRHPIATISAVNCTAQCGVAGAWHERLPHFRPEFTPSKGDELQSEYFVPRQKAVAALDAVARMRGAIEPRLQVSEIRSIAADDLWMSPCCG